MRQKHNAQSFPYRQRDRGMVTSNPIESEFLGLDRAHMHPVICTPLVSEELGRSTDSENLRAHNGRSILFCCLTTLSSLALPIFFQCCMVAPLPLSDRALHCMRQQEAML